LNPFPDEEGIMTLETPTPRSALLPSCTPFNFFSDEEEILAAGQGLNDPRDFYLS